MTHKIHGYRCALYAKITKPLFVPQNHLQYESNFHIISKRTKKNELQRHPERTEGVNIRPVMAL